MIWIYQSLSIMGIAWSPIAAEAAEPASFYTLGTGSGPQPKRQRAQPANLLMFNGHGILIDVGDGAAEQLGKIGVPLETVPTVFLSHLHFDHTGGLFALLSRRFQLLVAGKLLIYGPLGTRATVDALVAAMEPATSAQGNIRARATLPPGNTVKVIEIGNGWTGVIDGVKVTAASNSHYSLQAERDPAGADATFAFRFDMPGRSIVYTGDTGQSAAIEHLAQGADTLVSELMDPAEALADIRSARPDLSDSAVKAVSAHFYRQHLSPSEAGLMAQRSGVRTLAITHNAVSDANLDKARAEIKAQYKGLIEFAVDLQKF